MTHCDMLRLLKASQNSQHKALRNRKTASSATTNRKSSSITIWISQARSSLTTDSTRKSICRTQAQSTASPKASTGSTGLCQLMLVRTPKSNAKRIENACSKRTRSRSRTTSWPSAKSLGRPPSTRSKQLLILKELSGNADFRKNSRRRSKQKSM